MTSVPLPTRWHTSATYAHERADTYCSIHRDLLNEYFSVLGMECLSIDEVQHVEWKLVNDARGQDHRVHAAHR
jgi:hypothetical protein